MPCFESPIEDGLLLCGCFVTPPRPPGMDNSEYTKSLRHYTAMLDTGATGCCISRKVAAELGLQPEDNALTRGIHGEQESMLYKVDIGLFTTEMVHEKNSAGEIEPRQSLNLKMKSGALVSEFDASGEKFDAILGMSYLQMCTLIVSGGKFTLCY